MHAMRFLAFYIWYMLFGAFQYLMANFYLNNDVVSNNIDEKL